MNPDPIGMQIRKRRQIKVHFFYAEHTAGTKRRGRRERGKGRRALHRSSKEEKKKKVEDAFSSSTSPGGKKKKKAIRTTTTLEKIKGERRRQGKKGGEGEKASFSSSVER